MLLGSLTEPHLIFAQVAGLDRLSVLRSMADSMAEAGCVESANDLYQKLWEREQLGSTGIGGGVAIPHCKMKDLPRVILAVGVVAQGIDFDAADGEPVRLFFLLVSPSESPADHLQSLAAISKWVKNQGNVEKVLSLKNRDEIYSLLLEADAP